MMVTDRVPAHAGPAHRRPRAVPRLWARIPWSLLLAAVPMIIGLVRLIVALPRPFTSGGDDAFIELGVRSSLHHLATVGPYSRFGWHHPGPLMFDLFAPIYALAGDGSRALFVDSWLLNAVCALAVIAVVRRFAGEAAALAAVALLTAWLMATGFDRLLDPWNPSVLALPVLLAVVAAAAAASTGSLGALVVAAAAGSFAAQTHLGTVPIVVVALVFGVVGCLVARRRRSAGRARWGWRAAAVAVLVLAWVGPAANLVAHGRSSNVAAIVRFTLHPPASAGGTHHPLGTVVRAAVTFPAVVPLGFPSGLATGDARIAWCAAYAVIGLIVAVAARRRSRFAAALGLATPVALVVAVVAADRVTGPLEPYLLWWTSLLGLPALLGVAVLISSWLPRRGRVAWVVAAAVAAVVATGGWSRLVVEGATVSYPDSPDARVVAAAVADHLHGQAARIQVTDPQFADGPAILALVKDHQRFALDPPMDLYDGDLAGGLPAGAPTVVLAAPSHPLPTGAQVLARSGTLVAYVAP